MTKYNYKKNIVCTDNIKCSDEIVGKLENPNLKLHANTETDNVNGSVTIHHKQNDHEITIEIYDIDQLPNNEHLSTLKRPIVIPTKQALEALL